jgi:hypothetical protein
MRITTTDIYESSFLHCSGMILAEMWLDHGRLHNTAVFVFDGDCRLTELQKSYHTGNAVVNLADYRRSLNRLRELMFRLLDGQNQKSAIRRNRAAHENVPMQCLTANQSNRR